MLERRDTEAAAAANALQRTLLDILEQVSAERPISDADAVLAVFGAGGVDTLPRGRLLYYPALPPAREPPAEPFAAADAWEFKEPAKALEALAAPARSADAAVLAGAWLRIGRILRRAGRSSEALHAYERL